MPSDQTTGWRPLCVRVADGVEGPGDADSAVAMDGRLALWCVPGLGVIPGRFDPIGTCDWWVLNHEGVGYHSLLDLSPGGGADCLVPTHWMPLPEPPHDE